MSRSFVLSSLAALGLCAAAPAAADMHGAPAPGLVDIESGHLNEAVPIPTFKADASWPDMPGDLIFGQVPGLAVDAEDDVWILHRPNSLGGTDTGLAETPPIAACCKPAPHVLQFSPSGELISSWGGPELAPDMEGINQWPANVHGLYVDDAGTIWLGGNGDGDHVVLNYTADGEYIGQIGRRERTEGNFSEEFLGNPADISREGGSVLVADGYINKRIAAFDAGTGGFARLWGAYAEAPGSEVREQDFDQSQATSTGDGGADPDSASFGDIVHCVVRGPDSTIYVCDRRNNRLQLFHEAEDGTVSFVRDIVIAPETGGTRTASDVAFSPDGTYVYVADMMNGRVWILTRSDHEIVGWFGRNGRYPGQFTWLHSVDTDSAGNVYTTEVSTGRRVQKFVFTGMTGGE
ncbi:hypothetical protein B5C34_03465 [Pacificimonas flava]|uniref:Uncharacterized protein n=2 Tax=Pacificimonas TaxID=1960290 RepID=A0A219B2M9_9SPHN|nr:MULTISPECIES: hypothetical protein [Pacificimonas]MBZ6377722.1 hypothetical protein [Pacificimonas aurantium]OWV32600.1 hypothetical protein B5C34_03465 [Pacificimonas flava]